MIEVKVSDPHNFERAMKIFKKACQKDGFMMELKDIKICLFLIKNVSDFLNKLFG